MATASQIQRLKDAGIKNVDQMSGEAVEALAALNDDELITLAKAQDKTKDVRVADFGGVMF